MNSSISWALAASLLTVGTGTARHAAAAGQEPPRAVAEAVTFGQMDPGAEGLSVMCAARPEESDAFLAAVARARAIEDDDAAKAALDALEPGVRRRA
ncbi:MAG TPA: hypothetical protein VMN39_09430, partial [Longimicrobiaceae bacterium]|nr:hypothetical protein [Longimicrobiaceae bacterium]